jgi:hypothetical protein
MTVICKKCGEIYALVWRNDVDMRDGTIKKCKNCSPRKRDGRLN